MEISTGKKLKSRRKKIWKSDFAPTPMKNFPVTPLLKVNLTHEACRIQTEFPLFYEFRYLLTAFAPSRKC